MGLISTTELKPIVNSSPTGKSRGILIPSQGHGYGYSHQLSHKKTPWPGLVNIQKVIEHGDL